MSAPPPPPTVHKFGRQGLITSFFRMKYFKNYLKYILVFFLFLDFEATTSRFCMVIDLNENVQDDDDNDDDEPVVDYGLSH